MALRYWVGGSGNWSDTAKWSTTSGGTGGASVPGASDDVIVNGSSGSPAISLQSTGRSCLTITTTGATCSITSLTIFGGENLNVSGNATLSSTTTFGSVNLRIIANSTVTAGANIPSIEFNGSGNTFTIVGNLIAGSLSLTQGTLNIGANNVTLGFFFSTGASARTLNMGSGIWTFTGSSVGWSVSSSLVLNAQTANIVFNTSDNAIGFSGGGKVYNKITFEGSTSGQTFTISGSNTFTEFASTKTVAFNIEFEQGTTNTFDTFTISGSSGNVVDVKSTDNTTRATLIKTTPWLIGANSTISQCSGIYTIAGGGIDYLDFNDIDGRLTGASNTFLQVF